MTPNRRAVNTETLPMTQPKEQIRALLSVLKTQIHDLQEQGLVLNIPEDQLIINASLQTRSHNRLGVVGKFTVLLAADSDLATLAHWRRHPILPGRKRHRRHSKRPQDRCHHPHYLLATKSRRRGRDSGHTHLQGPGIFL
jgi:hypothetical protein